MATVWLVTDKPILEQIGAEGTAALPILLFKLNQVPCATTENDAFEITLAAASGQADKAAVTAFFRQRLADLERDPLEPGSPESICNGSGHAYQPPTCHCNQKAVAKTKDYWGLHSKLAASSVLPEPLYLAICG